MMRTKESSFSATVAATALLGSMGCTTSSSGLPTNGQEECTFVSDMGEETSIRVVNGTEMDVYMLETAEDAYGTISTPSGPASLIKKNCLPSCNAPFDEVGCGSQDPAPMAVRLTPGGHLDVKWNGSYPLIRTLPASCGDIDEEVSCLQYLAPEVGATLRFEGVASIECPEGEACDCSPNADGHCFVYDATSSEAATAAGTAEVQAVAPHDGYVVSLSSL